MELVTTLGGWEFGESGTAQKVGAVVEEYDPAANSWRARAPIAPW